jgi:hypothetical protein
MNTISKVKTYVLLNFENYKVTMKARLQNKSFARISCYHLDELQVKTLRYEHFILLLNS